MLFRNNHFATKHFSIGSEMSGGVRNVTMTDCVLGDPSNARRQLQVDPTPKSSAATWAGIHLKAERGRGGYIKEINLLNLDVVGPVSDPIFISMFYSDARPQTNATATPAFSQITLANVMVRDAQPGKAGWAGSLVGLPEAKITDIELRNVTVKGGSPGSQAWDCSAVASGTAAGVTPPLPAGCFAQQ